MIAMDIATAFESVGAVVAAAATLARATELVEADGLSAAVVDFGLRDGDAAKLCSRLGERGIPYILHSGYSHYGDTCHGGVVVPKPAEPATLIDALVGLLGGDNDQS